jgi:cellulose synthase/poly-beta-1,6-N-acetylglucosamine synthase-like glycosyltransferase
MLIIRIIEKLLIIYFSLYVIIDLFLYFFALGIFRRSQTNKKAVDLDVQANPMVTVIVPSYNEEVTIVDCVSMLMKQDYEPFQLIIVNDGSNDKTLMNLLENFAFESNDMMIQHHQINPHSKIKQIYTAENGTLVLIDKKNGGKADAMNAALTYASGEFICTIDADSILDAKALENVVRPMLTDETVFVSGGQIALSNGVRIIENRVVSANMPSKLLVLWQILEYISTFMVARISLSRMNALLIMSGAFSIFRTRDLLNVGGFLSKDNHHPYVFETIGSGKQVLTEDMEIVLRLWKYYKDRKRKAKAVFLPGPVCWTEAPEKYHQLYRQRQRWHQGLAETLWLYRSMIFEPSYGSIGMIAMPYYFFMELLAPVIKIVAVSLIGFLIFNSQISHWWVIYLIAATILLYTIILSSVTVMIERWSMSQTSVNRDALRYKGVMDWIILLFSGIIANFTYSFFRMFAQLAGIVSFLKKRHDWMKFERKGIKT